MNQVILTGRVTKKPKIYTGQTTTAKYALAVDRKFKREGQPTADFINCVAFGKQAEFADKYLDKGAKIGVTGHIQTGSYKAQDGRTVYTTDVIVETQEFMTSKAESASESVQDGFQSADDMDLPFD